MPKLCILMTPVQIDSNKVLIQINCIYQIISLAFIENKVKPALI